MTIGTKVATTSFVWQDAREGGFEVVVHIGDVFQSSHPVVTAAAVYFT
jgi:hypothetical protein